MVILKLESVLGLEMQQMFYRIQMVIMLNYANIEAAGNPWDVNLSLYVEITSGSRLTS